MTSSGFPSGSPMERMYHLTVEERAVVAGIVVGAIQSNGSATVEDFDRGLWFVNHNASMFIARLHGGPRDGDEMRMPPEYANYIGVPSLDEPITQDQMDAAHIMGEPLNVSTTMHGYQRRHGTPEPTPGTEADFDYVGPEAKA